MISWLKRLKRAMVLVADRDLMQWLAEARVDAARVAKLRAAFPSCHLDPMLVIHETAVDSIVLAEEVRLARGVVVALSGAAREPKSLSIGYATYVGEYCNLRAAEGTRIVIGARCLISQFCSIVADNHATPRGQLIAAAGVDGSRSGVTIGDDVWLGVGVSVLAGVTIGKGVVVGANSVVNCDIPDFEIWAGSPARKIGVRE